MYRVSTLIKNLEIRGVIRGMEGLTLEVKQGEQFELEFGLWDDNAGNALDITGGLIELTVKLDPADATPLIQKSSTDDEEIEITDAEQGEFTVYFQAEETETAKARTYFWEIKYTDADGRVSFPVHRQPFIISETLNP